MAGGTGPIEEGLNFRKKGLVEKVEQIERQYVPIEPSGFPNPYRTILKYLIKNDSRLGLFGFQVFIPGSSLYYLYKKEDIIKEIGNEEIIKKYSREKTKIKNDETFLAFVTDVFKYFLLYNVAVIGSRLIR